MPLTFDTPGLRFDTGLRFDAASGGGALPNQPTPRNRAMTKFKLDLKNKTAEDKLALGATHITAMTGNTNYPAATRVPTDAQVQTAQDELATATADADAAEVAWKNKIEIRKAKEAAWVTAITARANNCEAVTPNDLAALTSTGFPLRSAGAPIGALPAPGDLRAKATDDEGMIDLRCKTVAGASTYEWQFRLHEVTAAWAVFSTSTSTKLIKADLTPGAVYAFRVRAIGSAGPGTWSDEATERAP